jgi:hypothetical protein
MARPTKASQEQGNYLKEQLQLMEKYLNELEAICKSPNITQKEDFIGTIGLLVGKLGVRFINVVGELGIDFNE